MRWLLYVSIMFFSLQSVAQQTATIKGIVTDDEYQPLVGATIHILGTNQHTASSDSGKFSIVVPAQKAIALVISSSGFAEYRKGFFMNMGEQEFLIVHLQRPSRTMAEVVVSENRKVHTAGQVSINPRTVLNMPGISTGVESMIKTIVGSNNELSSSYSVRGGNYDENLMYINGYEVYRPYLVSSGQQEGLSLINPALTENINFYTGGFSAKYGDALSSVLDIQYLTPEKKGAIVQLGLLEQGISFWGSQKNKKITYIAGLRNKSNQSIVKSQPVNGVYIPSGNDIQSFITWQLNPKTSLELLGIYAVSAFNFYPESVTKIAATISPIYTSSIELRTDFEGREKDHYATLLTGLTLRQKVNDRIVLRWSASYFSDREKEDQQIDARFKLSNDSMLINSGTEITYRNNKLLMQIFALSHNGAYTNKSTSIEWGLQGSSTFITDSIRQYVYRDSFNYSGTPDAATVPGSIRNHLNENWQTIKAYTMVSKTLYSNASRFLFVAGIRSHYNNLNKEFLLSPRAQVLYYPAWKKNLILKAAAGIYSQPPFYRELRSPDGGIHTNVLAQKSTQYVLGAEYRFNPASGRRLWLNAEAYHKQMKAVNVYDMNNVHIQYAGNNNAIAQTSGLDIRLQGELSKNAPAWLSINFMRSRENLLNDQYKVYYNAAGEEITATSTDKIPADSSLQQGGWFRRPNDRSVNIGVYIEDYLSNNENIKFHLQLLYGTDLPYNVPGSIKHRNSLTIPGYMRADAGFSFLLLGPKTNMRSLSPFRNTESIWLSAELLNLFNRDNTISYQLISDRHDNYYALPNRLTPRMVNIKLMARF